MAVEKNVTLWFKTFTSMHAILMLHHHISSYQIRRCWKVEISFLPNEKFKSFMNFRLPQSFPPRWVWCRIHILQVIGWFDWEDAIGIPFPNDLVAQVNVHTWNFTDIMHCCSIKQGLKQFYILVTIPCLRDDIMPWLRVASSEPGISLNLGCLGSKDPPKNWCYHLYPLGSKDH